MIYDFSLQQFLHFTCFLHMKQNVFTVWYFFSSHYREKPLPLFSGPYLCKNPV